ncbi:hypothetical protein M885DRAFT_563990 [Pelagophyceae sp. CCMP2097]|nr:hypothetical protein M885DRAFT_563990 [Pelagophyceae sp. CCMP2097]
MSDVARVDDPSAMRSCSSQSRCRQLPDPFRSFGTPERPQTAVPLQDQGGLTALARSGFVLARAVQSEKPYRVPVRTAAAGPLRHLTTHKVPRGRDYARAYCGACEAAERPRCTFCGLRKLALWRRMPLVRVARSLLIAMPALSARDLAHDLARYAASDEACLETNRALGWSSHQIDLCEAHTSAKDAGDDEQRRLLEAMGELKKRCDTLGAEKRELRFELDGLQRRKAADAGATDAEVAAAAAAVVAATAAAAATVAAAAAATALQKLREDKDRLCKLAESQKAESQKAYDELRLATTHDTADATVQASVEAQALSTQTASDHETPVVHALVQTDALESIFTVAPADLLSAVAVLTVPAAAADVVVDVSPAVEAMTLTVEAAPPKALVNDRSMRFSLLNSSLKSRYVMSHKELYKAMHDVYEKQCQADDADRACGRDPEPLASTFHDYWRHKVGLKKMAAKKAREMLNSLRASADGGFRLTQFCWLLGLDVRSLDAAAPETLWAPAATTAYMALFGRAMKGEAQRVGIAEFLNASDVARVERRAFVDAVLGRSADERKTVVRSDPSTWKTELLGLLEPRDIEKLLDVVDEADCGLKDFVNLDDSMRLFFLKINEVLLIHEGRLGAAFLRFDHGSPGLTLDELGALVDWCTSGRSPYNARSLEQLYYRIESLCDPRNDDDEVIDNAAGFAASCLKIERCVLAMPRDCRDYWQLPDDAAA